MREYRFDALYDKLAFIGQRATLFSGSIRENVFFGQSAGDDTDADLQAALELAQASEFVSRLDKGTDYPVAQQGRNLSGGQKQRLSIARALARKPEILIFDDAFSALDYKTDAALRAGLAQALRRRRRSSSPSGLVPSATQTAFLYWSTARSSATGHTRRCCKTARSIARSP